MMKHEREKTEGETVFVQLKECRVEVVPSRGGCEKTEGRTRDHGCREEERILCDGNTWRESSSMRDRAKEGNVWHALNLVCCHDFRGNATCTKAPRRH